MFDSFMLIFLFTTLTIFDVLLVLSAPTVISTDTQAMMYLARFGYMDQVSQNPSSGEVISRGTFHQAILDFQSFAGLNHTGVLDEETYVWMSKPRCGVRDRVDSISALQGSHWEEKQHLTYKVTKYPRGSKSADVDRELAKATQLWADVTQLSFTHVLGSGDQKVDIEIRFESAEHGDGDVFDGPGGTLAHAYSPKYGGDVRFDDSETWTINSEEGTNLFQVAVHEFGHSLGLSHSAVKSAVMAPFYHGYQSHFVLDKDDITAIQQLYRKNPTKNASSELCDPNVKVDTIFTGSDKKTYVFKGEKYWRLEGGAIAPGYPQNITKDWTGLPGSIDAAFTWNNGQTYFFKGSKYWRFTSFEMDEGYPKDMTVGFPGLPANIDTAFVWSGNDKVYFFKGHKYWRFDPYQTPPIKSIYPKHISNWKGLPNHLDAGFQHTDGFTYFFKKGQYWKFNDQNFEVEKGTPEEYPRSVGKWWYGCDGDIDKAPPVRSHHVTAHSRVPTNSALCTVSSLGLLSHFLLTGTVTGFILLRLAIA